MPVPFDLVRRWWRLLAGLQALLLAHLVYYVALSGQGKSWSFRALALVVAGLAISTIGLAFGLTPARLERWQRRLKRLRWPLVGGALLALFVFGLQIRPEWLYAQMALTVAAALALIEWTLYGAEPSPKGTRLGLGLVALGVIAVIALRIYGLSVYPSIQYNDEPLNLGKAYSYLKTGHMSDWLYLGGENFEGKTYYYLQRFYIPYAWWLKLVGAGFWEARLFTFGLVLIVTGTGGRAARNLYGTPTGWFTAGALLASATLMVGARIRHDIGLALAMIVSLWLYSEAVRRDRPALHMLAGAAMGWGMFAHYHASGFAVVLTLALYGPRYIDRWRQGHRWPERAFWLYVGGGVIAALSVAAVQIFPDVNGFTHSRSPRNPHSLSRFIRSLRGHVGNIAHFSQVEFVLVALGLGAAAWRRQPADRTLVIVAVLGPVALAYMASVPFDELIVPLMPFYGMLIGALFGQGLRRAAPSREVWPGAAVTLAFALCVLPVLGTTLRDPLQNLRQGEPVRPPAPPQVQWVLDHLPTGATVAGEPYHFFWLTDYRFVTSRTASHMTGKEYARYGSDDAVWDAIGVDAFIFDPSVGTFGMLTPLKRDGYLESRGYQEAAKFTKRGFTATVYARAAP